MEQITKSTGKVKVTDGLMLVLLKDGIILSLREAERKFREKIDSLLEKDWVRIENKKIFYNHSHRLLVRDSIRDACPDGHFDSVLDGYNGRAMDGSEAGDLFYNNKAVNPLLKDGNSVWNGSNGLKYVLCLSGGSWIYFQLSNWSLWRGGNSDSNIAKIPVCSCNASICVREFFLKENLIPSALSDDEAAFFQFLKTLYTDGLLSFGSKEEGYPAVFDQAAAEKLIEGTVSIQEVYDISFDPEQIEVKIGKQEDVFQAEKLSSYFLECDYRRTEMEPYDEKILLDPNRGHWALWDTEDENITSVKIDQKWIGRNPAADVREDGIIGIDFGTKSTIVVYQDGDDHILPVRVGSGKFKKAAKKEDYENPTVMEFRHIEKFIRDYIRSDSRPETCWEDLTISHKAAEQLKAESDSSRFYSFFSDLKQWTADKTRQVRLRDDNGDEKLLPAFLEIGEDELNPVELYAYYLGLFINNMYRGIYLNYILSFPVTYEKKIREKIVESFEKGLKKSLPAEVTVDEELMKRFRVCQGASEPAAYAICALQEYGLEPGDGAEFYGIFDFGGGTTDFDFGIWREADEKEARRYDYAIEHFGAGGDQYLGGENLLELLAYHVFKKNKDALMKESITFYKPVECKEFLGSEMLLSNSQEARLNTRLLMEKLRGLWQNDSEEDIKAIEGGSVKLQLFTSAGKLVPNFELQVNREELLRILTERIEKGVRNFFDALYLNLEREGMEKFETVHIFLAGNSSKSPIVKELFKQHMKSQASELSEIKDELQETVKTIRKWLPEKRMGELSEEIWKRLVEVLAAGVKEIEKGEFEHLQERLEETGLQKELSEAGGLFKARDIINEMRLSETMSGIVKVLRACAETMEKEEPKKKSKKKEVKQPEKETNFKKELSFLLYPPLGTEEAIAIQKELGIVHEEGEEIGITGKTGVAYGLLEGRPGSRIKVISEIKSTDEIKFKYYIGENRKKKFHVVIDREQAFGEWKAFTDASEPDFEFYYSSLPEVCTNTLSIRDNGIHKKVCRIDQTEEDAEVYFRLTGPTTLEYGVATEEGIGKGELLGEAVAIELN